MNVGWLVLIGILAVGYPIVQTESYQYQEYLHECWKRHTANKNLVASESCRNPHQRLQYENAGTVNCDLAEKALLLSPTQCAFKLWWKHTEIVGVYNRLAGSYWTILGIVLPLLLFAMYLYSKQVREEKSEERLYSQQSKLISQFLPLQQPAIQYDNDDGPMFNLLEDKKRKIKK